MANLIKCLKLYKRLTINVCLMLLLSRTYTYIIYSKLFKHSVYQYVLKQIVGFKYSSFDT